VAARRPYDTLPLSARVFAELADGLFHSGEALAARLGVSRGAIWKAVRELREIGIVMHAVPNRGYRMAPATQPLDAAKILEHVTAETRSILRRLETTWCVDSTNSMLLARPNPPFGASEALLAEYQTAGRGRRGRAWLAPPGGLSACRRAGAFGKRPPTSVRSGWPSGFACCVRCAGRDSREA